MPPTLGPSSLRRATHFVARSVLSVVAVAAPVVGLHAEGHAGSHSCPVRLVPDPAPPAWRSAAAAATKRLSNLAQHHDCKAVEVIVRPDGAATLAFLTTDGRGAARSIAAPDELLPTLEALLVTLPPPPGSASAAATPLGPATVTSGRSDAGSVTPELRPVAPSPFAEGNVRAGDRRLELGLPLGVGLRAAIGSVGYLAPSLSIRPSLHMGSWSFGLFADASPVHYALGAPTYEARLWSVATGILVGRRESFRSWRFDYGLSFGVGAMGESADDLPGLESRFLDVLLPRLGAYARTTFPARGAVRFSTELSGDAHLGDLRDGGAKRRELPALPRFGATLSLGLEVPIL